MCFLAAAWKEVTFQGCQQVTSRTQVSLVTRAGVLDVGTFVPPGEVGRAVKGRCLSIQVTVQIVKPIV